MTPPLLLEQPALLGFCPITEAAESLARAGGVEARGAIYTRREAVGFILDLVGYTDTQPLHWRSLLELSFGGGDFLLAALDRLLASRARALR